MVISDIRSRQRNWPRSTAGKNTLRRISGETMAGAPEIQVSRLLDERGLGAYQIRLLLWAILLSLIDGYDIAAIAFAAPHLVSLLGHSAQRARSGAERQQYRRPVRLGDFRLGRRPLRPQAGADRRQHSVRHLHLHRRLFDRPDATVLAAADCRPRHRRRHSESGGDLHRVGAAQSARHAADRRRRLRAARRRARRRRQRVPRAALRLADPVSDRRHRADRHRARRHHVSAGIHQIHGAARKPARENDQGGRRAAAGLHRAARRALCHRGRTADAVVKSGLFVPARAVADHAAVVAFVRAQSDGLFLPLRLDADAADRGASCRQRRPRSRPRCCNSAARSARCRCAGGCSGIAFSPFRFCSCWRSRSSARSALPD